MIEAIKGILRTCKILNKKYFCTQFEVEENYVGLSSIKYKQ